mmetsp:Transcript_28219/g.46162  ORF Transcript_28219/g.46162 Transcript_28219/m.46162 type:complete len:116 (+) Transcript_28219:344-691(+)
MFGLCNHSAVPSLLTSTARLGACGPAAPGRPLAVLDCLATAGIEVASVDLNQITRARQSAALCMLLDHTLPFSTATSTSVRALAPGLPVSILAITIQDYTMQVARVAWNDLLCTS